MAENPQSFPQIITPGGTPRGFGLNPDPKVDPSLQLAPPDPSAIPVLDENISESLAHNFAVSELRIIKDRGFYGVMIPVIVRLAYTDAGTSSYYASPFFIADRPYKIIQITRRYNVASGAADAEFGVYTLNSGLSVTTSDYGFPLTTASNTNFTVGFNTTPALRDSSRSLIVAGDGLTLATNKTPTGCEGLTVAVLLRAV